jgi:hypothetical protein
MMTTRTRMIATVLGALAGGGLGGCDKTKTQTTEVPAGGGAPQPEPDGECLHSEGCCGGHTKGDGSCGAQEAEAGATADAAAAAAPAEAQRFEWTVEPGKFAEINVELEDGAKMTASYDADGAPVAWNVHSHPGDKPTIHAEGSDAKGTQSFAPDKGGLYSYLGINKGKQPVKLTVELRIEGAGRVHSTHP